MADNDDFEIIGDIGLSNDQTYELVDIDDHVGQTPVLILPRTPDIDFPLPVSPMVESVLSELVQQPIPVTPTIVSSPIKEQQAPFKTSPPITPTSPLRRLAPLALATVSESRTFAPVPPLPKAPAPRRYGDAATIPHNLNETVDINALLEKSRRQQQNALAASLGNSQKADIQTVLDQRRQLLNNKAPHCWTTTCNCLHRKTMWSNQNRYVLLFLFFGFLPHSLSLSVYLGFITYPLRSFPHIITVSMRHALRLARYRTAVCFENKYIDICMFFSR